MIERIDHFVLTVHSLEATCKFYERVLGFTRVDADGKPTALRFGRQTINVHQVGHTFEAKSACPTGGSADFCLITKRPTDEVREHLRSQGVVIEVGPVEREGAEGKMTSVYFCDRDQNLVEPRSCRLATISARPSIVDAADGSTRTTWPPECRRTRCDRTAAPGCCR